jgi:large repetitive protein
VRAKKHQPTAGKKTAARSVGRTAKPGIGGIAGILVICEITLATYGRQMRSPHFKLVQIAGFAACLASTAAFAQAPASVVKIADFYQGPNTIASVGVDSAVFFDGKTYFSTCDATHGCELWTTTDGQIANTRLFADLCPGRCNGKPRNFYVENNTLFFSAQHPTLGRELWRLGAGASDPILFADINPGAESSDPAQFKRLSFTTNTGVSVTRTFFTAERDDVGVELWRLDDSLGLATLEIDLLPGASGSDPANIDVLPATGRITLDADRLNTVGGDTARRPLILNYFTATGTPVGTSILPNAPPFSNNTLSMQIGINRFFLVDFPVADQGLWVTRGDSTAAVRLINRASASSALFGRRLSMNTAQGRAYVFMQAPGGGTEAWSSDGTTASTILLGTGQFVAAASAGARQVFLEKAPAAGQVNVLTDVGGTGLAQIFSTAFVFDDIVELVSSDGGRALFAVGAGLFASSGTAASTFGIANFSASGGNVGFIRPVDVNRAMFTAGVPGRPYYIDLSLENPLRAVRDPALDANHSFAQAFGRLQDALIISAPEPTPTRLLALRGINRQTLDANSVAWQTSVKLGGRLGLFNQFENAYRVTDGTPAGTSSVQTRPGSEGARCFVERNGAIYFKRAGEIVGAEIRRADFLGNDVAIAATQSGGGVSNCSSRNVTIAALGGNLLYAASTPLGNELLVLDASDQNVTTIDIEPGVSGSRPGNFVASAGLMFMSADTASFGDELWVSDGTASGTRLLVDIEPGPESSFPRSMTRLGNRVLFTARTLAGGRELYASDGTAAGTVRLADLVAGPGSAFSGADVLRTSPFLALSTNKAWFTPAIPFSTCRLFETDGTPSGTRCALDPALPVNTPGIFHVTEAVVTPAGIVVVAAQGPQGVEIAAIQGRALIPITNFNIAPGRLSSSPYGLLNDGDDVLFTANDQSTGYELYRLTLPGDKLFSNGFE